MRMLHRREGCGERARPAETIVNPISVNGRRGLIAVGPTRDLRSLIGLVVDQYPFDPNEELAGDIGAAFAGSVGTAISVANARAAIRAFMIRLHVLDHRPRSVHQRGGRSAGACSGPSPSGYRES